MGKNREFTEIPPVRAATRGKWVASVIVGVVAATGWLSVAGCDGRSLGVGDPDNTHHPDGTTTPGPDSGGPPETDGSTVTCHDSPLQGIWLGTFDGTVNSPDVGSIPVTGTVRLEIYCEFGLNVSGELTGSESSGVDFRMEVAGRYFESLDSMDATFAGHVGGYPATGTLTGNLHSGWPDSLVGGWDVRVDDWDMTGNGHWSAVLE